MKLLSDKPTCMMVNAALNVESLIFWNPHVGSKIGKFGLISGQNQSHNY